MSKKSKKISGKNSPNSHANVGDPVVRRVWDGTYAFGIITKVDINNNNSGVREEYWVAWPDHQNGPYGPIDIAVWREHYNNIRLNLGL